MSNLPKLPEPVEIYFSHYGYTEAQMLQFQADTLEVCVQQVEKLRGTWWISIEAANECADAIRSLK